MEWAKATLRGFLMNKFIVCILLTASSCFASPVSQKSLITDGVYAAGFGELAADMGSVLGYQISNFRMQFGFQALRYEDYIALSLGYGKVGFHDALRNHDTKDGRFQLDYSGPLVTINLFPSFWINAELMYFIKPQGKGSEKILDATHTDENMGLSDVRYRYNFDVEDAMFSIGVKIWNETRLVLGLGQRHFKWKSKITDSATEGLEVDPSTIETSSSRPIKGSESGSYIFLAIRGTTM